MGDHQISSIHAFFADLRSTKGRHLVQEINSSLHHRIHQSGTSPLAQTQIKLQHRVDIQLLEHACMTTFIRLMREDAIIENRRLHPCGHQQRTSDNEAINQQYHASLRCSQHCPHHHRDLEAAKTSQHIEWRTYLRMQIDRGFNHFLLMQNAGRCQARTCTSALRNLHAGQFMYYRRSSCRIANAHLAKTKHIPLQDTDEISPMLQCHLTLRSTHRRFFSEITRPWRHFALMKYITLTKIVVHTCVNNV